MTVKRFKKILNDNSEAPKRGENGYDKLYKFRPLIDKLNQEFHHQCVATSSQSIDEAMIFTKTVYANEAHQTWIQGMGTC